MRRSRVKQIITIAVAIAVIAAVSYFFATRDYGTLSVKVVRIDGTPISGVALQVIRVGKTQNSSPDHSVATNRDGLVSIQLPAGEYMIAFDPKISPQEYTYPNPFSASVQTQSTTVRSIQLLSTGQSEKKATLQVRVLLQGGAPARDIEAALWNPAAPENPVAGFTKTDALGIVVFTVPLGDYVLGFNHDAFPPDYIFQEKTLVSLKEGRNEKVIQLVFMP
ncbi:MAG: hypothetical protein HYU39_00435 [Thaumarchaeota archaeon]|nr:hypothetical protein [Nitrososphaerota archaeon]